VHAVASKGFNLQTDAYAQTRPSYPEALLNKIQGILPAKASVVDLAGGTGLMSRALKVLVLRRLSLRRKQGGNA
ncbi:hypothetical protein BD408DRAFT_466049, partial [Parasitella parasitica]